MNQILDYNPNKSSGGGTSGSDKVVRVFAVILAIFAICLLAGGAYGIYKNNSTSNLPAQATTKAQIDIEQRETTAVIKVKHDKVIEKLIYNWDSEKENTVKGSGESVMESEIPLFAGEHTLNVKVIDIEGNETTYEQAITSESGEDKLYPVIALNVNNDTKRLVITATDETAIDYVTYRWNDEEEQKVEVEDDDKKIEFDIEILKGKNDLTIIAVDKNKNTTTEVKSFSGVTKPDVKVVFSADKKTADVYCYHENGIKEVKFKINDQDYNGDIGEEPLKEITFNGIALPEGSSTITVTVSSVDETETVVTENVDNADTSNEENIDISIEKSQTDETKATIKTSCASGVKEIKLNVNDVDYNVDLQGQVAPEVGPFDLDLVEGNNKITLTVISANGTEKQEVKEITR